MKCLINQSPLNCHLYLAADLCSHGEIKKYIPRRLTGAYYSERQVIGRRKILEHGARVRGHSSQGLTA